MACVAGFVERIYLKKLAALSEIQSMRDRLGSSVAVVNGRQTTPGVASTNQSYEEGEGSRSPDAAHKRSDQGNRQEGQRNRHKNNGNGLLTGLCLVSVWFESVYRVGSC